MTETKQSQCQRIVKALKAARSRGLTSHDLSQYALSYTRRVTEIRRAGWKIESFRLESGAWRYILHPASWA